MAKFQFSKYSVLKMLNNIYNKYSVQVSKLQSGFLNEFIIYKIMLWPLALWPLEKKNVSQTIRYLIALSSQVRYHYNAMGLTNLEHF